MEPFDASRLFLTVMSWYSVLSADCQNVLTVEYCVPKGVLYIAHLQNLLLAIVGLPKEVIFLCVWHITCKMLLYAHSMIGLISLNHTGVKWNQEHPSIHPYFTQSKKSVPATGAPALLSVFLPP